MSVTSVQEAVSEFLAESQTPKENYQKILQCKMLGTLTQISADLEINYGGENFFIDTADG